jgi:enamine deaminase RidA (YjgF/YER057c/UK114 family)
MVTVRLTTGHEIELDGDLLHVLEVLYREVSLKSEFKATFEDVMREIRELVEQMSTEDRKRYLVESLFLNSVTYENEMLDAYMRKIAGARKKPRVRSQGRAS